MVAVYRALFHTINRIFKPMSYLISPALSRYFIEWTCPNSIIRSNFIILFILFYLFCFWIIKHWLNRLNQLYICKVNILKFINDKLWLISIYVIFNHWFLSVSCFNLRLIIVEIDNIGLVRFKINIYVA